MVEARCRIACQSAAARAAVAGDMTEWIDTLFSGPCQQGSRAF